MSEQGKHATPDAKWRAQGEPDPHEGVYNCERAKLCMGNLTDDELANALYLCDHRTSLASIAYLTAAKDRIRWLSRKLAEATERAPDVQPLALTDVCPKCLGTGLQFHPYPTEPTPCPACRSAAAQPVVATTPAEDALRELVRLKDLKERVERDYVLLQSSGSHDERQAHRERTAEYARCKEPAWAAARAALANSRTVGDSIREYVASPEGVAAIESAIASAEKDSQALAESRRVDPDLLHKPFAAEQDQEGRR